MGTRTGRRGQPSAATQPPRGEQRRSATETAGARGRRWAWFVALYAGSAIAFALLTYGLRAVIPR